MWEACYGVFEVILFMLRFPPDVEGEAPKEVLTPIASETYFQAFKDLVREHPECWHLCQKAEDRCRAEHFPRLARQLREEKGRMPSWSEVFIAAARDDRYWDREVRRPALGFLARGKRKLSTQDEDSEDGNRQKISRTARRRKAEAAARDKGKKDKEDGPDKQTKGKGKGDGKSKHPRKDKAGFFTTTRDGQEICFRFARGDRGDCSDPCPNKRAHVCQKCLQPHRNGSEACTHSS